MYRFTNGVVCYDIETRDKYIKAGMTLVKEEKPEVKEVKEDVESGNQSKIERSGHTRTDRQSSKFNRRYK